jgi:hypothetical protein
VVLSGYSDFYRQSIGKPYTLKVVVTNKTKWYNDESHTLAYTIVYANVIGIYISVVIGGSLRVLRLLLPLKLVAMI